MGEDHVYLKYAYKKNGKQLYFHSLKIMARKYNIQPCGLNEATALDIAKYVSQSEPTQIDSSVA